MGRVVHLVLVRVEDDLEAFVDVRLVVGVLHMSWGRVRSSPVETKNMQRKAGA
jgi:hypothetical protein